MIKLFITDLDGCISIPFESPDWELLSQIRRLNEQSSHDMAVPSLSICSGRPFPYVEAVAQWLGIDSHVVFESAGVYKLATNEIQLHPTFDKEAEQQVSELKKWLRKEMVPQYQGTIIEFTKKMDAGLIHLDSNVIQEMYPQVVEYVEEHYPRFEVHDTDVSINIILADNNKRTGIRQLCNIMDVKPDEVAYIGDSSGDIPGLQFVGKAFAPQNAAEAVKEEAEVLEGEVTEAVLVAYRQIIRENRKKIAAAG
ncbi:HAD-IIB family hydrolase [Fodinibius sp. SL11]|uniref:HAD-IIB family hydrolase n=1 Tax=Fodinibius sp. SL11 TaxID=3425690 RepID=UPI003F880B65